MSKIQQISEAEFQTRVLDNEKTVLVDFSAVWCGPCRMQTPILEKFAAAHEDVDVVKVDVDDDPALASKYEVRGIPTILLFKKGEKVASKVGLTRLEDLDALI
jgi:thioredoxin 1